MTELHVTHYGIPNMSRAKLHEVHPVPSRRPISSRIEVPKYASQPAALPTSNKPDLRWEIPHATLLHIPTDDVTKEILLRLPQATDCIGAADMGARSPIGPVQNTKFQPHSDSNFLLKPFRISEKVHLWHFDRWANRHCKKRRMPSLLHSDNSRNHTEIELRVELKIIVSQIYGVNKTEISWNCKSIHWITYESTGTVKTLCNFCFGAQNIHTRQKHVAHWLQFSVVDDRCNIFSIAIRNVTNCVPMFEENVLKWKLAFHI